MFKMDIKPRVQDHKFVEEFESWHVETALELHGYDIQGVLEVGGRVKSKEFQVDIVLGLGFRLGE